MQFKYRTTSALSWRQLWQLVFLSAIERVRRGDKAYDFSSGSILSFSS